MIRAFAFTLTLFVAAACAQPESEPVAEAPPPPAAAPVATPQTAEEATAQDTCGMANFQHLIGVHMDQIDRATLPPRARIITPDSMVTQDFSAERLNLFTGTDGRVSSMRCF
jgi:hypothetical protein